MLNRFRRTLLFLCLALALSPGLSLAAGQSRRSPAAEGSSFERLFAWVERAWEALAGGSPAPAESSLQKVGCGIDPNGSCVNQYSTGGH
jgi:hypothetical protein